MCRIYIYRVAGSDINPGAIIAPTAKSEVVYAIGVYHR